MDSTNSILNKINKFGILYLFRPTDKIIKKVSYEYPYDGTFGNPFTRTPKYDTKIIKNITIYFSHKNVAYFVQTGCRNESIFLLKVLNSKLYRSLITKHNVSITNLKFPEYSRFHNHDDIDKFLKWFFHLS